MNEKSIKRTPRKKKIEEEAKIVDKRIDKEETIGIEILPNKNCKEKDCYGRGHIGFSRTLRKYIFCSCILEQISKTQNNTYIIHGKRLEKDK